jgi:hypothetical protein
MVGRSEEDEAGDISTNRYVADARGHTVELPENVDTLGFGSIIRQTKTGSSRAMARAFTAESRANTAFL